MIRLALGAETGDLLRLMIGQSMKLALTGSQPAQSLLTG